jgi:uncharacterized protein YaiI (UPF0178 family)
MTQPIEIYVDADACPVKDEVYRVAERHGLKVHVVSNRPIAVPREPWIERVVVGAGLDAADDWIAERAGTSDIVVTADIPLASRAIKARAAVIAPNGKTYDEESIGLALATRNLLHDLWFRRNHRRTEIVHRARPLGVPVGARSGDRADQAPQRGAIDLTLM